MMCSAYSLSKQGDSRQPCHSFLNLEPIICSIQGSNCCFLTCIQVSQETGEVVCYPHLSKSFSQFVMIHTVKGFIIVDETEIDDFLKFPCFSIIQRMLAIWSLVPLPFLNPAWTSGSSWFTIMLKPSMQDFKHDLTSMGDEWSCPMVSTFFGTTCFENWYEDWPFPVLWPLLGLPDLLT